MCEVKKRPKILQCENCSVVLRTDNCRKKSNEVIVTKEKCRNSAFQPRDLQNVDAKILQSHFPAKLIKKSTTNE